MSQKVRTALFVIVVYLYFLFTPRFENVQDAERYYSVNEGYRALVQQQQEQQQQLLQQDQGQAQIQEQRKSGPKRFEGYVFRPYPCFGSEHKEEENL